LTREILVILFQKKKIQRVAHTATFNRFMLIVRLLRAYWTHFDSAITTAASSVVMATKVKHQWRGNGIFPNWVLMATYRRYANCVFTPIKWKSVEKVIRRTDGNIFTTSQIFQN
jgi:hypothetical protein